MDTTNKKTCTYMLDRDVVAAIEKAALAQRMSKSTFVNGLLAAALAHEGLMEFERQPPLPNKLPGRKTPAKPAPAPARKPKR